MYQSFRIKNFRGFRDLTLDSLERVNLIAGQNNVGKTALLEAIFLHLGPNNPELSLRVNSWRGFQPLSPSADEVWAPLFHDLDTKTVITLEGNLQPIGRAELRLSLAVPETVRLTTAETENGEFASGMTTIPSMRQLKLEYTVENAPPVVSWATVMAQGEIRMQSAPISRILPASFNSTAFHSAREDADRLSALARTKRREEVLDILRILEPRLQHLEVQSFAGMSVIMGDIGLSEFLPIGMMGEGLTRLLSIILAILSVRQGVVLIDEVENGLHYSVMSKVWRAIAQAARASDVQVFATTHSWECICAAHEAFTSDSLYDFRLHRLEWANGDIRAVSLDQEMLDTAIKAGLEVR
jgi:hypothetical protein